MNFYVRSRQISLLTKSFPRQLENSKELSSQSNKILDPRPEPNKWLKATLLDLLERSDKEPEAMEALKWAIPQLCHCIEPGYVDQIFADWIEQYIEILENNQNKVNN